MEMRMRNKAARIAAILIMIILAAAMITSCGNKKSSDGPAPEPEKAKPAEPVAEKCYVLAGMSSDEEEFDEELLKEMFSIDELSEYMAVYFDKEDKVYVSSLVYGKKPVEGNYTQDNEKVSVDLGKVDSMELTVGEDGILTGYIESDNEFTITLVKTDDIPKPLKSVVK